MAKNKDLSDHPVFQALGAILVMFALAAAWVIVAGIIAAILTGDIHPLYPENLLKGIFSALSSHP